MKNFLIFVFVIVFFGCNTDPVSPVTQEPNIELDYSLCQDSPNDCFGTGPGFNYNDVPYDNTITVKYRQNALVDSVLFSYNNRRDLVYSMFQDDMGYCDVQIDIDPHDYPSTTTLEGLFLMLANNNYNIDYRMFFNSSFTPQLTSSKDGTINEVSSLHEYLMITDPVFLDSAVVQSSLLMNEPHVVKKYKARVRFQGLMEDNNFNYQLLLRFDREFVFVFRNPI